MQNQNQNKLRDAYKSAQLWLQNVTDYLVILITPCKTDTTEPSRKKWRESISKSVQRDLKEKALHRILNDLPECGTEVTPVTKNNQLVNIGERSKDLYLTEYDYFWSDWEHSNLSTDNREWCEMALRFERTFK